MISSRRAAWPIGAAAVILGVWSSAVWAQEAQQRQYGGYTNALDQFFTSGGMIVWFIQFPMSIVMVALAIQYIITIRRGTLLPPDVRQQVQTLVEQRQYREALEYTAAEPSMFSRAIHTALAAATGGLSSMQRALDEAIDERVTKLLRRIEVMNIIGNIAPMIGLFGTIYGLILAFNQLVLARGTPEPAQLAGAISVAMVTTFWGLLTAIPALSVFAWFRNRIDGLAAECAVAGEELLGVIQGSQRSPAPPSAAAQAPGRTGAPVAAGAGAARPPVAQRLDEGGAK